MKDLVYVTHPIDGEVEVLVEHHKNGLMIISAGAVGDVHMLLPSPHLNLQWVCFHFVLFR